MKAPVRNIKITAVIRNCQNTRTPHSPEMSITATGGIFFVHISMSAPANNTREAIFSIDNAISEKTDVPNRARSATVTKEEKTIAQTAGRIVVRTREKMFPLRYFT